ncbi:hypothetical protein CDL12_18672 [Handroanthus impetiginosus]|uniref:RING-type E3 ubiquitin transferase n=1 Tax=Handroanthus impetiginosus TaxID=429701 RepID=A0A2G9GU49_9LAMI|nr:hypothetical protein CDL12_18672 [Handroanthus impetiginosus]
MQRERSALGSFPEPIDLNQGSLPNNTSMDHSASWNNVMNPVENRMSSYVRASNDANASCMNVANECAPSFSGWDHGESSSGTNNIHNDADDSKMRLQWPSTEGWFSEPSNISTTSYVGNHVAGRPPRMQNYGSNVDSLNTISNPGHVRELELQRSIEASLPHNLCKSGQSEMDQIPNFYPSSSNIGTSSGSSNISENIDASCPSFGTWGSSCKRKAVEGTSGQFYPGGSSSSNQPMGKSVMQHPVPGCYTPPRNLTISSGPLNLSPTNHLEQPNPSSGVGASRVAPGPFPSLNVPGIAESSARTSSIRSNHGRNESVRFDTPGGTSLRNFGAYAVQPSRPISTTDSSELRTQVTLPMNSNNTLNQPHLMNVNEGRGLHSYPWNGSFGLRVGSSSSALMAPGERGRDEVNVRSSRRDNLEHPMTVSAPETRNVQQDQIDWSFVPPPSSSSRNHSSGSRIGSGSGGRSFHPAWLPHQHPTSQNHQRLSEAPDWTPFPPSRVESESGNRRSHFGLFPSASSSSDEVATSSRTQHNLDRLSAAFLMDMPGDDIHGWRALAGVQGRHRLIRQLLNAMRRGVHLQAEDYTLIDPFISGIAELHDRHRDMRLDVDNMSYEELLALEELIGNVSTGLSEEKICGSMKQRKFEATGISQILEPCCICQEDYITGDDLGVLDCGHEFHTICIKQWLILKNLCPICKMVGLGT